MRDNIFEEINTERKYQDSRWGNTFDNKNTVNDWVTYIGIYAGHAADMDNVNDPVKQREFMVKTAALAVAALEAFDRNNGFAARHYDPAEPVTV